MKIREKILKIFFPEKLKCIFCGRDIADFNTRCYCEKCANEIKFNNADNKCKICDMPLEKANEICDFCKKEKKSFDRAVSCFIYDGPVKRAVLRFKRDGKFLTEQLAKFMAEKVRAEKLSFDVIIPVPSSKKELKKRGYNQAKLLADELGKILNVKAVDNVILKTKETKHQKNLSFSDRQHNLTNSFELALKEEILNKDILLVDDVLTTGATLSACARILKKSAGKIFAITFARTVLKKEEN